MKWYLAGFAALGIAIGYFIGASQSPVVAAALPLLFALISGAGGLYLSKVNLSDKPALGKLAALGKTIVVFVLLLLVGTFVGIGQRTGLGLFRTVAETFSGSEMVTIDAAELPTLDAVRLVLLRNNLHAVGTSDVELGQILKSAGTRADPTYDKTNASSVFAQIAALSTKLRDGVAPVSPKTQTSADGTEYIPTEEQQMADLINGLRSVAFNLSHEADYFSRRLQQSDRETSLTTLSTRIGYYSGQLSELAHAEQIIGWLSENTALGDTTYDLELLLADFKRRIDDNNLSLVDQANTQINTFLGTRTASAEPGPDPFAAPLRGLASLDRPISLWSNN